MKCLLPSFLTRLVLLWFIATLADAAVLAQNTINCARLTSGLENLGGVVRRVFEVGTLNRNGTFTANPNFGMTWALFANDVDAGQFKVGSYYLHAEIGLEEIPAFQAFYKTNFSLRLVRLGRLANGGVSNLFNRYEVVIGGPGGAVRPNNTSVLEPTLEQAPDVVPPLNASSFKLASININLGAENEIGTFYSASNLPPGLTLSSAGILSGTMYVGGNWNTLITAERAGRSTSRYILFRNPTQVTFSSLESQPVTPRTQSVTTLVNVPVGNLPAGEVVAVSGRVDVGDAVRYIAAPQPPPTMDYANLSILSPTLASASGQNGFSSTSFNQTRPLVGNWKLTASVPSYANTTNNHSFAASGKLSFCIMPLPEDFQAPTLTIAFPQQNFSTRENSITFYGTAADNFAVAQVEVSVNTDGSPTAAWMRIKGKESWSYTLPVIRLGANVIHVRCKDLVGNVSAVASRNFTAIGFSRLSVNSTEGGRVSSGFDGTSRQVGQRFSIQAKPEKGYIFKEWIDETGATQSTEAKFEFEMTLNKSLTAVFRPNPFPAVAGNSQGLLFSWRDYSPIGLSTLTIRPEGAFAATVHLEGETLRASGTFDGFGNAYKSVSRSDGRPPVLLSFFAAIDGREQHTVTVKIDSQDIADGLLLPVEYSSKNPLPAEYRGRYNVVAAISEANSFPGSSFFTISTSSSGSYSLSGKTANGTSIKTSGKVLLGGRIIFYTRQSSEKSWLAGECMIDGLTQTVNSVTGIRWDKAPNPKSSTFPEGFSYFFYAYGAKYVAPPSNQRVMSLGSKENVVLRVWTADASQEYPFLITEKNKAASLPANVKIGISASSGMIEGSLMFPNANKKAEIQGIIVGEAAYGYLMAPAESPASGKIYGGFSLSPQ